MIPPPGLPPMRGVGKLSERNKEYCTFTYEKNKILFAGVAPAGARVPLRGPMTRGDYGKLSMIQYCEID